MRLRTKVASQSVTSLKTHAPAHKSCSPEYETRAAVEEKTLKTHAPAHKSCPKARKHLKKMLKTLEDMTKKTFFYLKLSKNMPKILEDSVKNTKKRQKKTRKSQKD